MKLLLRRLVNRAGFDISRYPRWSGTAQDYYRYDFKPRWGHGLGSHSHMQQILSADIPSFVALLNDFQNYRSYFDTIPANETAPTEPYWNNGWFSTLDAAALMFFLLSHTPKTYIEIGSGLSTKFARRAISSRAAPGTRVISIDPQPRAEIDAICDHVIRSPLETIDLTIFDQLESGDIAFFDGSHRIFTNSDATVFFLEVVPRLKPGVLIHAHDIFWPDDYTPEWNQRYYSEQYALGAMILGGLSLYKIVLPNYFVSTHPTTAPLVAALGIPTRYQENLPGLSFWFSAK